MISSIRISSLPNVMFNKTKCAPVMSQSLSRGDSNASITAVRARPSPDAFPDPMMARPELRMTVFTSFMSTLISPVRVMTSAMPLAAVQRISSALLKAVRMAKFPYNSRNLSFRMMSKVSTDSRICSRPFCACAVLRFPSNWNGMVTMPTVRMSISRAACAITGAAPVPVPPPIPAVMKTMLVLSPINFLTSSIDSMAALRPTSGSEPAPWPRVSVMPNCTLTGTGLASNAWASVLQMMKSTP